MSFKHHDTNDNNMIHLGNYEEYFILYMDNELSEGQMAMVDEFLVHHPDLRGEFELLMSTRLPMEEMSINKDELMSGMMKMNTVDEELLLYIDNELPAEERKVVELEIRNNKDFQLQHQLLMKSKLDASDNVLHPNKKELYRREERKVVAFRPWMRVAAAVVVIAAAGLLYFTNSSTSTGNPDLTASRGAKNIEQKEKVQQLPSQTENAVASTSERKEQEEKIMQKPGNKRSATPAIEDEPQLPKEVINNIAQLKKQNEQIMPGVENPEEVLKNRTSIIENKSLTDVAVAEIKTPSEIINKNSVTSALANRNTGVDADPKDKVEVASNKGSVKGFLRKTTRLIEKKTGIDPTNNGELLIGAVAINLN